MKAEITLSGIIDLEINDSSWDDRDLEDSWDDSCWGDSFRLQLGR